MADVGHVQPGSAGIPGAALLNGWRSLLAALSGGLLALAYVFPSCFVLAWIAFVPLLLALSNTGINASYRYGLLAGLVFYMGAGYWITDFLVLFKGYGQAESFVVAIVFWMYCAQLPALLAASLTWFRHWLRLSDLLLFPLLIVGFYAGFPMLFPVQLGESQAAFLPALQAVEWTGVYGLDFIIGLANVVLFRLFFEGRAGQSFATFAAASVIALWLVCGLFASAKWDSEIAEWPQRRIGMVQPNEAAELGKPRVYPGYSRAYPPEMEMSGRLAAAGAELVIWPEGRYKGYFDESRIAEAFAAEAARLGVPLVLQDIEREQSSESSSESERFNSVAFLRDGTQQGHYRKMKRIAFGEALPLLGYWPRAETWARQYFGTFLRDVSPGNGPAVFELGDMRLLPLVCYETLFPVFTARALPADPAGSILVGVSNGSWFGNTRQPFQHANAAALRAVENRVPMVHVLNNGPSMAIAPNGRVIFQSELGQAGGFIVDLPHSPVSGGSFFSRYPHWFITGVYGSLLLMLVAALRPKLAGRRVAIPSPNP